MSTDVFCRDCKHRIPDVIARVVMIGWNCTFDKCGLSPRNDRARTEFLVSGKAKQAQSQYCSIERSYGNLCGSEGKLFEAKP